MNKNWYSIEFKSRDELNKDAGAQGFFKSSANENWDGKTYKRNFHELRCRDLALFTLGRIEGRRILDIGCGSGRYLIILAKMGAQVAGQDISERSISIGHKILKEEKINGELKVGDATILQFPDKSFDCVFTADFFEHITFEQKQKVVSEAYRILKPGGIFTIKTPNLSYLRVAINLKRTYNLLTLKSPFIYIPHTNSNPNNEHHGLTTFSELERILDENFFHTPKIVYVPLLRKGLPRLISKLLFGKKYFTETIIVSTRKALFSGFYE